MARQPECIVIAGPNGSGKTTFARGLLKRSFVAALDRLVMVNPDDIAATEFMGEPYESVILNAAETAATRREVALREGRHLLLETVFSAPGKLDFLRRAKAAGHLVRLVFIATEDPAINVARVAHRVACGGHHVPTDRIFARFPKSLANAPEGLKIADLGYVFDNSVWGEAPRKVFETVDGRTTWADPSISDVSEGLPRWARVVLEQVGTPLSPTYP